MIYIIYDEFYSLGCFEYWVTNNHEISYDNYLKECFIDTLTEFDSRLGCIETWTILNVDKLKLYYDKIWIIIE